MMNYPQHIPMGMIPQQPERQTPPQQQFGFPSFPGFPDQSVNRRIDQLERQIQRLDRQVERLDRRVDRLERQLGFTGRPEHPGHTDTPGGYY
ncbi:bZIP transcription factor [Lederbergia lenta]|uniref:Uncharacterized protein n=1 Tax=Lederbergia lenta TaxID=1467 RepID=A0A2X4WRL0_LEDLE|nr:bZIP transcription factor [Lederbergia lenta]MCM3113405.1 bZIP transcription factor [Lederbergia lenta]MEC2326450.1 bZIP transcription factor [Lederbergia lenta]SQI61242.1 Uncharacterised protein [Lederbergia lenta]